MKKFNKFLVNEFTERSLALDHCINLSGCGAEILSIAYDVLSKEFESIKIKHEADLVIEVNDSVLFLGSIVSIQESSKGVYSFTDICNVRHVVRESDLPRHKLVQKWEACLRYRYNY